MKFKKAALDRQHVALCARQDGATYVEIGHSLGVCAVRAQQLVASAMRKQQLMTNPTSHFKRYLECLAE